MNALYREIIRGAAWLLSIYLISLDLFFLIGTIFEDVFDEKTSLGEQLAVTTLVAINLAGVAWIFLSTSKTRFLNHRVQTIAVFSTLLIVTISHLLAVRVEWIEANYDNLHNIETHSLKTLVVLLCYGLFLSTHNFFCKKSRAMNN